MNRFTPLSAASTPPAPSRTRRIALGWTVALAWLGISFAAGPAAAAPPTEADRALLAAADLHAAAPGSLHARVKLEPLQAGRTPVQLELWRRGDEALMRFLDERNRGKAFLQLRDASWFLARNARPVKLSPGHRFAAGVSLQEILGLAFSRDYRIESVSRLGAGGDLVSFDLRAKGAGTAYPRVTYVVRAATRRPVRIELRLASGKLARMIELVSWAAGPRLAPAELLVKDLVGGQPAVRVRFSELEERQPPAHLFALGPEGEKARAALGGR